MATIAEKVLVLSFSTVILITSPAAWAGTFEITSVSYGGWLRDGFRLVTVEAQAKYMGTLDINDQAWLIQTFLNDSYGNDLEDWANPDFVGAGKNGTSITPGMTITCSDGCAANGSIERPICGQGETIQYLGKAGVTIYHQFSPEIDLDFASPATLECMFEQQTNDPQPNPGDPTCSHEGCTPILINLGSENLLLTDWSQGVDFDIDGDGQRESISWTDPQGMAAFLVLDRNGNGVIDDGTELFGGATEQPPSIEPNGFRALAVFDRTDMGGDGDGWISERDSIFDRLQLWMDIDHDGASQPDELVGLSAAKVQTLALNPVVSGRRDAHGNLFRWASQVRFFDQQRLAAVDVVFLSE